MTHRLYYTDSLLDRFDATVVESGILADGRHYVVLDRSGFYPTSGGQPHDLGVLGDAVVTDVFDRDADGQVVHVVDRALAAGVEVSGRIDLARRIDHVQQHSGQHLLSAAFIRACDAPTVSFHLGADVSTIDVAVVLDAAAVARAEDLANQVVWENRTVSVRFVSEDEAARLPLRKEPTRGGTLRLVEIADWDLSACGGTHASATGGIGAVVVTGTERYKGGLRVSFVCGGRAVRYVRTLRDASAAAARHLSVLTGELPDAVARLQADQKALRQELRGLGERLATYEATDLAGTAVEAGGVRVALAILENRDGAALKTLAQAVAVRGCAAILVSASRPALVAVARGELGALDAGAVVRALIARFGGKGGGRQELAQAGGLDGDAAAIRDEALRLVTGAGLNA
jgi:alanyl-tRNA synthetase